MILGISGIDYSVYSRMLLFVLGFLVSWRIEPNSRALSLQLDYKAVTSKLSKKQNVTSKKTIFQVLLEKIIFTLHLKNDSNSFR